AWTTASSSGRPLMASANSATTVSAKESAVSVAASAEISAAALSGSEAVSTVPVHSATTVSAYESTRSAAAYVIASVVSTDDEAAVSIYVSVLDSAAASATGSLASCPNVPAAPSTTGSADASEKDAPAASSNERDDV